MKSNLSVNYSPSFGKVIPVKKIVFDDDSTIKYNQLSFDTFESNNDEQIDTSCDSETSKKTLQALNRILMKNDKAESNTYKNALNNMIRMSFAHTDSDYKIPSKPVDSCHNEIIKPCYSSYRNYLLTGKEAGEYSVSGRNIGGAIALEHEDDRAYYMVDRSRKNFHDSKESILANPKVRLKNQYGGNMGLVVYAYKEDVPLKGHKGFRTEINIKGIDFEPV